MNDEVKLDNTFKMSFMTDVDKGMEYLHKSHLHSHGNLKSSNCLVDGRWTVRVRTGLKHFLPTSQLQFARGNDGFVTKLESGQKF